MHFGGGEWVYKPKYVPIMAENALFSGISVGT